MDLKDTQTIEKLDEAQDKIAKMEWYQQNQHTFPPLPSADLENEIMDLYANHPEINNNIDPNAWNQTYTCKKFFPKNPTPESICIEDIAHALSMQCRFGGHTSCFYSTAQHSVLVSFLCGKDLELHGLIHDAAEAYCGDMLAPTKGLPELKPYKDLENNIQLAICMKFGVPFGHVADVKRADMLALSIEARSLMAPINNEWKLPFPNIGLEITPLAPKESEALFLNRFVELTR